jgi:hypothetical protein
MGTLEEVSKYAARQRFLLSKGVICRTRMDGEQDLRMHDHSAKSRDDIFSANPIHAGVSKGGGGEINVRFVSVLK